MKRLFSSLFGGSSKPEKKDEAVRSKYMPAVEVPIEESFTIKFTKQGGKFIYCESKKESIEAFKNILSENKWDDCEMLCFDSKLQERFVRPSITPTKTNLNARFFLTTCEFLVAHDGSLIMCAEQIANHKLIDLGGENKVLYVWFDAPIGYISATKEWAQKNNTDWELYWKDKNTELVHFIGKDNIVFHCIIFPSMLHAEGSYVLPTNVPANEFLNLEGQKLSTSKNWAVWLHEYLEDFPGKQDVLRYVLTANAPENKDNDFTWKDFQARNDNELVAIYGNFINRILVLTHKYYDGVVPTPNATETVDEETLSELSTLPVQIAESIEKYRFREASQLLLKIARLGNKYLADEEPWKKQKIDPERVKTIMYVGLQIAANSPLQTFGEYMPGDIKYKDINNDGLIDINDEVPIGYPTTPKIIYGFGLSSSYKNLDFSFFFQGSAQSSFFIDAYNSSPFIDTYGGAIGNNALLNAWADDYWSEDNRNLYAAWPRLSDQLIDNNNRNSTWWLRDGTFLRLKSVELGYTIKNGFISNLKITNARIYFTGTNLLTFSKFKIWDVEMGGNGLGYPIQLGVNFGVNLNF